MGWEDDTTPVRVVTPIVIPRSLSHLERVTKFGRLKWSLQSTPEDPLRIRVDPTWEREHIMNAFIGWHGGRHIRVHKLALRQVEELWKAWLADGLESYIVSFDGAYVPRFKRGTKITELSEYKLSNHSWGTAFDVNARWNPMGRAGAPMGAIGSVAKLVARAHALGFAWGGDWSGKSVDPMHFEIGE